MKKKLLTLALAAGLVWGCVTEAKAIEFKASGEWLMGFGAVDKSFQTNKNGPKSDDTFQAVQRIRLQLDAVANEYLSGTFQIEIGDTKWGSNADNGGGALGADQTIIEVMSAYLDWYVPNTELQFRMGIFGAALPNAAGGAAIIDEQVAGVVANWAINDMASVTAMWLRPFNDNYNADSNVPNKADNFSNYLDNVDLFALAVPLKFDGFEVTPWALYGAVGQNHLYADGNMSTPVAGGLLPVGFAGGAAGMKRENAYGSLFFAGLPIIVSAADPWNIEFDINYGSMTGFDDYAITPNGGVAEQAGSNRAGWVVKALVEYQLDWGRPGLFAWYGSGDDDDVENGSERMPFISPAGNFTSFGFDGYGWGGMGESGLLGNHYDGTWGIGLQLSEFSFVEDLSHTLRVAYIGGTNSTGMMKYVGSGYTGDNATYLTTQDYLVEINFDSVYSIYENLNAIFEIGYIINGFDTDEWNKKGVKDNFGGKQDAWKVDLIFEYSF